jgi:hypothetical protein
MEPTVPGFVASVVQVTRSGLASSVDLHNRGGVVSRPLSERIAEESQGRTEHLRENTGRDRTYKLRFPADAGYGRDG